MCNIFFAVYKEHVKVLVAIATATHCTQWSPCVWAMSQVYEAMQGISYGLKGVY